MEVNIIDKGPIKIIGMSIETLLQDAGHTGPALHERFMKQIGEITNRVNPAVDYAVSIDPPNYNDDTDNFKLMIGVEVNSFDQVPIDMESLELPAGQYASLIKTDDSTFGTLIRWVFASEYELTDTFSIEIHDNSLKSVVLLFPIQKK